MLTVVEQLRVELSSQWDAEKRSHLGQFMTPLSIARFMASLFPTSNLQVCRLLDPGAGIGSLSSAFLDRWADGDFHFRHVEVTAYEIDETLRPHLETTLSSYSTYLSVQPNIRTGDFVEHAVNDCLQGKDGYTHAILNPPYKKINSNSHHRLALRQLGIETVNLYSAFVALSLTLLDQGGALVAIIPRSFCNGPYYRPFREFILDRAAIRHMHLFDARDKAFRDDGVLQENIIILLERGGEQGDVTVSTSADDSFTDYETHIHPFDRIVFPNDPDRFIHVPTTVEHAAIELASSICYTLKELGLTVSTGPVVDFRLREHLCQMPEPGTVPLLYPGHFAGFATQWPQPRMKKPNAIHRNVETERWLFPVGYYAVTRRFSSKEEARRVVASVVDPTVLDGASALGFENHLNVFHDSKHGLSKELALGLAVFLNSTLVDEYFRRWSGHTQVNATDLRAMKYPSREVLEQLGRRASELETHTQEQIDAQLESIIR